jgi:hypothetical protein
LLLGRLNGDRSVETEPSTYDQINVTGSELVNHSKRNVKCIMAKVS